MVMDNVILTNHVLLDTPEQIMMNLEHVFLFLLLPHQRTVTLLILIPVPA
jgi:hypothetical protein